MVTETTAGPVVCTSTVGVELEFETEHCFAKLSSNS